MNRNPVPVVSTATMRMLQGHAMRGGRGQCTITGSCCSKNILSIIDLKKNNQKILLVMIKYRNRVI